MTPRRLALLLVAVGVTCVGAGVALAPWREALFVLGIFFIFLAGGVLNWDRRGGH